MHGVLGVGPPTLCKLGTKAEVPLWRMRLDYMCIRWVMSYGHDCRLWFLRSLWSNTFLSTWVLFPVVIVLWASFFKYQKHTSLNWAYCMWPLTRLFLPTKAGHVYNSRLISDTWTQFLELDSGRRQATRGIHNRASRYRMMVEFSKTCSKRQVCVNLR
jgi:hypothetical protein